MTRFKTLLMMLTLAVCSTCASAQQFFGQFNCAPGSGQVYDSRLPANAGDLFYTHDQCSYSMYFDGTGQVHGTFKILTEVGVTQAGLYVFDVNFPTTFQIRELHGNASLLNWCPILNVRNTKLNGFTVDIQGQDLNAASPQLHNLYSLKEITQSPDIRDPIKADFPLPVPVSQLLFYHQIDNCAWSTYSLALDGTF